MSSRATVKIEYLSMRARSSGAALVVGLLLLLVMTLLAISGMSTSTLELQMAGNLQYSRKSLQAADFAIEDALARANYDSAVPVVIPTTALSSSANEADNFTSTTAADNTTGGVTNVPPSSAAGFSLDVAGGMRAYHFEITATGTSARNATTSAVQGFFVVGPGGG